MVSTDWPHPPSYHRQIFEWWYFRKYGTSFIEQVSLTHLSPWLGGADPQADGGAAGTNGSEGSDTGSNNGDGQSQTPGKHAGQADQNVDRRTEEWTG